MSRYWSEDEKPTGTYDEAREHRKGTCELCGRSRKLGRYGKYWWRCRECFPIIDGSDEFKAMLEIAEQQRAKRALSARKAYPIVGGPLDGERAMTDDFRRGWTSTSNPKWNVEAGMYAHLHNEYVEYNCGHHGGGPSMIFVHVSCLQPTTSGRNR